MARDGAQATGAAAGRRTCLAGPMDITHLGHSCLLVESAGTRVLLDPGTFSHGFEELTGLAPC